MLSRATPFFCLIFFINLRVFGQTEVSLHELKEVSGKKYYSTIPFSGIATTYFDNGQKEQSLSYKEGLLDGTILYWYSNGVLKEKHSYKKNQLDGKQQAFHKNGEKSSYGVYKIGKKEGKCKWWYDNKQVRMEATFKDNRYYGEVNVFDLDGVFLGGASIVEGTGKWEAWYADGSRKEVGQFENGYKTGHWIYYLEFTGKVWMYWWGGVSHICPVKDSNPTDVTVRHQNIP